MEEQKDPQLAERIRVAKEAHAAGHKKAKEELHQKMGGTYVRDVVYSANDGIITTFAVVAGVAGAGLSPNIILILGFANLCADGLSMAIGNYLGTKSELEYNENERKMEEWEIEHIPEEEQKEIREIYAKKGFKGTDLDIAVRVITSNKEIWVREMMVDELGILPDDDTSPLKNGSATFIAFIIAGLLPLLPYVFGSGSAWGLSIFMTGFALFLVGSVRTWITGKKWFVGGVEMLLVGAIAAVVAYSVGNAIEKFVM